MFYSSHHVQHHCGSPGAIFRVTFTLALRMLACLICAAIFMNAVQATDPPAAPRHATPYVRPTQYHLLPAIYSNEIDRVPTVEDLVPVLDDSVALRLSSGPVESARRGDLAGSANDWPYTEASHGRGRIGSADDIPARIGAFRPARVPSKYSTPWEHNQASQIQQVQYQQQVPFRRTHGDAPEFRFEPALFETISSPFVNQPVQQMASPVWDNEGHGSVVTPVSGEETMPIPDSFPSAASTAVLPYDHSAMAMSAPYHENLNTIHRADCQCEFCQSPSFHAPQMLFDDRPSAMISQRQTSVRFDGLVWWSNSSSVPALATTSPVGTDFGVAGISGNPTTTSVFSDHAFAEAAPGYRIQFDRDLEGYGGISLQFLQLGTRSENLNVSSDQFPILARPFVEASTGASSASVIAFPGTSSGAIQIQMNSRFRSAAVHYYQLAIEQSSESTDDQLVARFQIGPRIASLREDFWSRDHSFDLVNDSVQQRTDSFSAQNLFVGGEVGMLLNRRFRSVDLSAGLSLAVGANRQKFQSGGNSVLTESTGQTVTNDSGWLSSSVGAGQVNRNRFSAIPSAEFGIGFETKWGWKLSFGYDVMLWTNAVRVTEQISGQLDTANGAGAGDAIRPFHSLKDDSFLAHGVSLGIERRW